MPLQKGIAIALGFVLVAIGACNSPDAVLRASSGATSSSTTGAGGAGAGGGGAGGGGQGGDPGGAEWQKGYGQAGTGQAVTRIAADANGNLVMTGLFDSTLDFGGGPVGALGPIDGFIVKLSPSGEPQWTLSFGESAQTQTTYDITTDGQRIVVGGIYEGQVSIGGQPLPKTDDIAGDAFVAALGEDGSAAWTVGFGVTGGDSVRGVAIDAQKNVVLTGAVAGSVSIAGGPPTTAYGGADVLVAKLDASGGHVWSKAFGDGNYWQIGHAIAVDANGNVFATGEFGGSIDFGGNLLAAKASTDMFVAAFAANGDPLWSRGFGLAGDVDVRGIAADASGNVVVAGVLSGTAQFGANPLTSAGNGSAFVAKLSALSGEGLWSKVFGDAEAGANGLALDASGNVWLTGYYRGQPDFGGGKLPIFGQCDGASPCYDTFLVELDPDGNHVFSRGVGGTGNDYGAAVAHDGVGHLFAAGRYSAGADFGAPDPLPTSGQDVFVARYAR